MSYQQTNTYGNVVITYPQIIMEQIQAIQKIYSKELRDGDKILKNAMGEQLIEGEDTRYSFLQAVECLGILLSPYFIEKKKNNEEFVAYSALLDKELVEILDDADFKKRVHSIFGVVETKSLSEEIKNNEVMKNQINLFFLNYKLQSARKTFRTLVQLFKDHDFLSTETYIDSDTRSDSMVYVDEGDEKLKFDEKDEDLILENVGEPE